MLCLLPLRAGAACTRMTDPLCRKRAAQASGEAAPSGKPGRRSPQAAKAEAIVPRVPTRRGRAATVFTPEGSGRPGDLAPRFRRPPANADGGGLPGSARPRAPGRRGPAASVSTATSPQPGRLSGLRTAAARARDHSRSSRRPQPAAHPQPHRCSPDGHPHRALVRGAPHAGGGRQPGSWASAPQS